MAKLKGWWVMFDLNQLHWHRCQFGGDRTFGLPVVRASATVSDISVVFFMMDP